MSLDTDRALGPDLGHWMLAWEPNPCEDTVGRP